MRSLIVRAASVLALLWACAPASAYTLSGTYYEDTIVLPNSCDNFTACTAKFQLPAATAGKFFYLRTAACFGTVQGELVRGHFYLSDGLSDENARRYQGLALPGRGPNQFSWREDLNIKVAGGPPRVINIFMLKNVGGGAWTTVNCSIIGELADQ